MTATVVEALKVVDINHDNAQRCTLPGQAFELFWDFGKQIVAVTQGG